MVIIFFDIKGIVHKEFVLAGQTFISAYYCDCVNMFGDFAPNFGDKGTGCWITIMHNFTLPFSPGCHFETIEVI
jgi:hypothetical protein